MSVTAAITCIYALGNFFLFLITCRWPQLKFIFYAYRCEFCADHTKFVENKKKYDFLPRWLQLNHALCTSEFMNDAAYIHIHCNKFIESNVSIEKWAQMHIFDFGWSSIVGVLLFLFIRIYR